MAHGDLLTFVALARHLASNRPDRGDQMDHEEFQRRLDAARTLAELKRVEAVAALAKNVDLRHENGEAFTRERERQLRKDGQIGMEPNPIQAPDWER